MNKGIIKVLGSIWMPSTTAAYDYKLTSNDVANLKNENGEITREAIANWLATNAGDFRSITDFYADIKMDGKSHIFNWEEQDNEFMYVDCMFGPDF